jgi:hypothetical protein
VPFGLGTAGGATRHGDDLQSNTGVSFDLRRLRKEDHARFVNPSYQALLLRLNFCLWIERQMQTLWL